jgi:hypothetical protein
MLVAKNAARGGCRQGVIYAETGDEKSVLGCFEEGLRGGFGAIIADSSGFRWMASRRLQLAAESSGAIEGPLDHYLDIITGPVGQASLFQHQIARYDARHTDQLTDRLHELGDLSVRLIWGERDGSQRLEWARRLHTAIPGSEGNFVMKDAPGTVGHS